jgi:DNA-binding CsgD family transcriptional regulator
MRLGEVTPRELAVLRAYAETGDYQLAAARLGIAPSTVKAHLKSVRTRLDVDSTVVAVWRLRDRMAA